MATATPLYLSLIPTSKQLSSPFPRTHFNTHHLLLPSSHPTLRSTPTFKISAATATPSIDVERGTTSFTPAKSLPFRVGHGFDLHRLEPGYPLIIGGISIPHDRGCEAHSDGDVLLHCVVDAILGALGLPDIGQIFPDSDPKWKGAASSVFIKEAGHPMNRQNDCA